MATLVLTAVGTAFGGPLGGALGAALGQQVDRSIFGSGPARQGPRLKELDVQTSSYGTFIPAIFGGMRIAGTVIWASKLTEESIKTSNGKGRPATQNYSYSANIAVALSSRPLQSIGRIWADGNLLRGAAGDFKTQTGFRFYSGHGDQMPDPLLSSAEQQTAMLAYRGLAYVVFEGLQLADYGNRIPSLTFEVFERAVSVSVDDIAATLSGEVITGNSNEHVNGYAASGQDARAALSPLFQAMPVQLQLRDDALVLTGSANGDARATHAINIAASVGSRALPGDQFQLRPADSVPSKFAVRYYDPSRDYQIGAQSSERSGAGQRSNSIELPVAIGAQSARRLAELQLTQLHRQRAQWSGYVTDQAAQFEIGDWMEFAGNEPRLRIVEIEQQRGYVKLTAIGAIEEPPPTVFPTEAGQHLSPLDLAIGHSRLVPMDLPAMSAIIPETPIVAIAAAGTSAGWRSAALSQVIANQSLDLGSTAPAAIMGAAQNILPLHPPTLFDRQNMIEVELLHPGMQLPLAPQYALCWLEGEIIRYRAATAISQTRYRITDLERGLFGTEGYAANHQTGDRFVLLDQDRLRILDVDSRSNGQPSEYSVLGIGDNIPATATLPDIGKSIRPFAPIHGRLDKRGDGGVHITWVQRARVDFGWADGVDHPLIEDVERYALTLLSAQQSLAQWTSTQPYFEVDAAQWTLLAAMLAPDAVIQIRQIGRYAISAPLTVSAIS